MKDVVGVAEIEAQFGVDRMQISRLIDAGDFPAPMATIAAGRVWQFGSVEKAIARLRKERRLTEDGRIIPRRYLET